MLTPQTDFSRYIENLSLNLSPKRRKTLNFPPFRVGKGVIGLGFSWDFPDYVKNQPAQEVVEYFLFGSPLAL